MFDVYNSSLLGIWLILATIIIQAIVAVRVHRRQSGGYSPGVIKSELGQSSIVFRAHRTYQNFLDNSQNLAKFSNMISKTHCLTMVQLLDHHYQRLQQFLN